MYLSPIPIPIYMNSSIVPIISVNNNACNINYVLFHNLSVDGMTKGHHEDAEHYQTQLIVCKSL